MHIMRVGLKGSNFQGWPISLPVSSIALDFALTNNLTRIYFDHVHCSSGFLLTLLFTQTVSKALFVFPIEYIFLNLIIQLHSS